MNINLEEKAAPVILTHEFHDARLFALLLHRIRESGEAWTFTRKSGM